MAASSLQKNLHDYDHPTDMLVESTAFCNYECPMCPQATIKRPKGEMSELLWKKIVDDLAAYSPSTILWPAIIGEPLLLGSKIFSRIAYAKSAGIKKICLNTNLSLLTPELAVAATQCNLNELIIGLDAHTADVYSRIRKGGDFGQVMRNFDILMEEKVKTGSDLRVIVQMIVQAENEHQRESFIEFWRSKKINIEIKIREKISWGGAIEPCERLRNGKHDRHACLWLLRQMSVLWNGLVPQCDCPGENYFGNLNQQTIQEVWQGGLKKVRLRHLDNDFNMQPCNLCSDWNVARSEYITLP